jgi:hypothetical protein
MVRGAVARCRENAKNLMPRGPRPGVRPHVGRRSARSHGPSPSATPRPGLVQRRGRTRGADTEPRRGGAVGVRARAATERGLRSRLSADSLRTLCGLSAECRARRGAVGPLAFTMFPCSVSRVVHLYQLRYNQGIRRLGSAGRFGNADCSLCARCELRSMPPDRALTANSSGRSVPFSPSARTLRSMWPRS